MLQRKDDQPVKGAGQTLTIQHRLPKSNQIRLALD